MNSRILSAIVLLNILPLIICTCPTLTPFVTATTHGNIAISGFTVPLLTRLINVANQFDTNCNGTQYVPPDWAIPGYSAVAENGQLAIYKRECKVLGLWCGNLSAPAMYPYTSGIPDRPLQESDLICIYSVAKFIEGMATTMLLERKNIRWTERIGDYWSEFSQNGKQDIRFVDLLSHSAGLTWIPQINITDLALDTGNYSLLVSVLEKSYPNWAVRSAFGYSPIAVGWFIDVLFTKVDPRGRNVRQFIADEIALPTGSEIYFGIMPNQTSLLNRTADIRAGLFAPRSSPDWQALSYSFTNPTSIAYQALNNPVELWVQPLTVNIPLGKGINLPAGIVFSNADSLARMAIPFTMSGRGSLILASHESIAEATRTIYRGNDASQFSPIAYDVAGFWGRAKRYPLENDDVFSHNGAAGALLFSDPIEQITFSYVTADFSPATDNNLNPLNTCTLLYTFYGWDKTRCYS